LIFPVGDPIAYPSATSAAGTDTLVGGGVDGDSMRLIVPEFFDNMGGRMSQPQSIDHLERNWNEASASTLFSFGRGGLLDGSIASIFNDVEVDASVETSMKFREGL
jgi:hypothetical protein